MTLQMNTGVVQDPLENSSPHQASPNKQLQAIDRSSKESETSNSVRLCPSQRHSMESDGGNDADPEDDHTPLKHGHEDSDDDSDTVDIPQFDGAADQCSLSNDFGTTGLVTFSHSAPEIIPGEFLDPALDQHSFASARISPSLNALLVPESSSCPATAQIEGAVDDDLFDKDLTDNNFCIAPQVDDLFDRGLTDGRHCTAITQIDGQDDDDLTDGSRCTAIAQIDGQDDDHFTDISLADECLPITKTWSWVKGDDKEPLSTNITVQASHSEERSGNVDRRPTILPNISLPIHQNSAEGAYPSTHLSAKNSSQPTPRNCIGDIGLSRHPTGSTQSSIFNSLVPPQAFLTVPAALQYSRRSSCAHNGRNQEAAPRASATPGPTAARFTEDFPTSAEQSVSPIPIIKITKASSDDSQPGICKVLTVDSLESATQEPTGDNPTANGHESTAQKPTCDIPPINDHESIAQESTRDRPTADDDESIAEEFSVKGCEGGIEEATCCDGRVISTFFKWLRDLVREAPDLNDPYEGIERASSVDMERGRQDSVSSNSPCGDGGCSSIIINPLRYIPRSWFHRRDSLQEAHHAESGVPQTISDMHERPSAPLKQFQAHRSGPETPPHMPNFQENYFDFPCQAPPSPPSLSRPLCFQQNSLNVHQAGRGGI